MKENISSQRNNIAPSSKGNSMSFSTENLSNMARNFGTSQFSIQITWSLKFEVQKLNFSIDKVWNFPISSFAKISRKWPFFLPMTKIDFFFQIISGTFVNDKSYEQRHWWLVGGEVPLALIQVH